MKIWTFTVCFITLFLIVKLSETESFEVAGSGAGLSGVEVVASVAKTPINAETNSDF